MATVSGIHQWPPRLTTPLLCLPPCSATTYSVVQSFVQTAHALRKTFLISLLQPAPEVRPASCSAQEWLCPRAGAMWRGLPG